MQQALGQPPPEIKQTELQYPTRDGSYIRAKLYQPVDLRKERSPLIVMYHGGGFCFGDVEDEEESCRIFVQAFGAVCVSATYRKAPEFRFPYAANDCWDCLKWAATRAETWGADPTAGFVVGGTSAGGNLAAVMAHLARDENLSPPLTGQYLAVPLLLPSRRVPEQYKEFYRSFEQNKDAPVLPTALLNLVLREYRPNDDDGILYDTFNHPKGHMELPPAFFQVAGLDPLRDEAIIYEGILRENCGIRTKMNIYAGLPHYWWASFPFLGTAKTFRKDQVNGMGFLLGRNSG
ncbi:hypothetical protein H2204_001821 [Knufia peltigerae]|uniref:Alpha/beta hydrolase fold-3 domain-containing protein n=1 Tax=Knufia peltigerae TaxID=1002370 RepID=A0AA39D217_9EURO|nr:hypothetical protein H2204_001821 [Knufia peltigerae]